jgi:hypothetical protein
MVVKGKILMSDAGSNNKIDQGNIGKKIIGKQVKSMGCSCLVSSLPVLIPIIIIVILLALVAEIFKSPLDHIQQVTELSSCQGGVDSKDCRDALVKGFKGRL